MPSGQPRISITPIRRRRVPAGERDQLYADIAARYRGGASMRTIAAAVGYSYPFVNDVLHKLGVPIRPRGGSRPRRTTRRASQAQIR